MTEPELRRDVLERDVHSHANPHEVRVHHLDLDLNVRFTERRLSGSVTLLIDRVRTGAEMLVLDTRDLALHGVENTTGDDGTLEAEYELGETDPITWVRRFPPISSPLRSGTSLFKAGTGAWVYTQNRRCFLPQRPPPGQAAGR